jgi:hypothetical protein
MKQTIVLIIHLIPLNYSMSADQHNKQNIVNKTKKELPKFGQIAVGLMLLNASKNYLKKSAMSAFHCGQYINISKDKTYIWDNVRFYSKLSFENAAIGSLLAYTGYRQIINSKWPQRCKKYITFLVEKLNNSSA